MLKAETGLGSKKFGQGLSPQTFLSVSWMDTMKLYRSHAVAFVWAACLQALPGFRTSWQKWNHLKEFLDDVLLKSVLFIVPGSYL